MMKRFQRIQNGADLLHSLPRLSPPLARPRLILLLFRWMLSFRELAWMFSFVACAGYLGVPEGVYPLWLQTLIKCAVIWAWAVAVPADEEHGRKIAVALFVCSIGDGFLEFQGNWPEHGQAFFLAGLVSFLSGHLLFVPAFCPKHGVRMFTERPLVTLMALGYSLAFYAYLHPHLPSALCIPVLIYALVLASMLIAACVRSLSLAGGRGGSLAAIGALSFVVSDSVLAANKFVAPVPHAKMTVMLSYYMAQGLIAASATYNSDAPKTTRGRPQRDHAAPLPAARPQRRSPRFA
jgi:uncharacterized membrane protein YhhN